MLPTSSSFCSSTNHQLDLLILKKNAITQLQPLLPHVSNQCQGDVHLKESQAGGAAPPGEWKRRGRSLQASCKVYTGTSCRGQEEIRLTVQAPSMSRGENNALGFRKRRAGRILHLWNSLWITMETKPYLTKLVSQSEHICPARNTNFSTLYAFQVTKQELGLGRH